jgi:hypothetical protein
MAEYRGGQVGRFDAASIDAILGLYGIISESRISNT